VVCYKGSWISYQIAKRLITLEYISLVNLIMDREVVTELIQTTLTPENLNRELQEILQGRGREEQLRAYEVLRTKLGGAGASNKAAKLIVDFTKTS
jgi:lipid-A-disaccharide synthase